MEITSRGSSPAVRAFQRLCLPSPSATPAAIKHSEPPEPRRGSPHLTCGSPGGQRRDSGQCRARDSAGTRAGLGTVPGLTGAGPDPARPRSGSPHRWGRWGRGARAAPAGAAPAAPPGPAPSAASSRRVPGTSDIPQHPRHL